MSLFDPNVWSGRAWQEDSSIWRMRSCINVSGLWLEHVLPAIMDISARAISLPERPQWAVWVTSVRMRREDRSPISSHPLEDLGGLEAWGSHHCVVIGRLREISS